MPRPITGIDAHAHVLLKDLPMTTERHSPLERDYALPELLAEMDASGISHALLTAPSIYATDNSLLLAAIAQAPDRLRGTVILDPQETEATIADLSKQGICGIRLNWWRKKQIPDIAAYRDLFCKIRDFGWLLELFIDGVHLPDVLPVIRDTRVKLVLDHFGCPEPVRHIHGPGFHAMLGAIGDGNTWVKLSAPYRLGGADPRAYAAELQRSAGADRLVWATDWPFVGFDEGVTYQTCLQWLHDWVPREEDRRKVLVDTPAKLFGFLS